MVLGVVVVVLLGAHLVVLVGAVFFGAVFFAVVFFGVGDGCQLHPGERQRQSER